MEKFQYEYCVLDNAFDDILWVKFWNNESSFFVCVCYLPPDGSTRLNDAEQFYTRLTEQVYQYQNLGNVFICGDFNSRCGEASDYVEGVDDVRERDVIDVTSNHYGDLLLNFLVDCNFCMINGRVKGKNDFTHVSHRGRSVVDYVLVPHEQLRDVTSMNISLMTETIERFDLAACDRIPDHSLLIWESEVFASLSENNAGVDQNNSSSRKRFNVLNIPSDFLNNDETTILIERTIERIETSISEEHGADGAYSAFMDLIYTEMDSKLKSFTINLT